MFTVTDENGTKASACRYRGPNNSRCLIGLHIPDDLYSPFMEGTSILGLVAQLPARFFAVQPAALGAAQNALHDVFDLRKRNGQPEDRRQSYIDFAKRYDLTVPTT